MSPFHLIAHTTRCRTRWFTLKMRSQQLPLAWTSLLGGIGGPPQLTEHARIPLAV